MEWVKNALAALAGELAQAEADSREKDRLYRKAMEAGQAADRKVEDLQAARKALRALLVDGEKEVPL